MARASGRTNDPSRAIDLHLGVSRLDPAAPLLASVVDCLPHSRDSSHEVLAPSAYAEAGVPFACTPLAEGARRAATPTRGLRAQGLATLSAKPLAPTPLEASFSLQHSRGSPFRAFLPGHDPDPSRDPVLPGASPPNPTAWTLRSEGLLPQPEPHSHPRRIGPGRSRCSLERFDLPGSLSRAPPAASPPPIPSRPWQPRPFRGQAAQASGSSERPGPAFPSVEGAGLHGLSR